MKRVRFWILLMTCCLMGLTMQAQVSYVFVPEVQGRTLDGLLKAKTVNTGPAVQGKLHIAVTEQHSGVLVNITTITFNVLPGVNPLPAGLAAAATMNFGTSSVAKVLRQSGYFPAGDYEYCFELEATDKTDGSTSQCFDYDLEPFSPLLLTTPAEKEQICDKRPSFFWQPLLPMLSGMQYRLSLTEVKDGQSLVEALHYNLPLINQVGINGPFLFFPPSAPELQEGHRYAWQVTAYMGDLVLQNSEVWDFSIVCKEEEKPLPAESFRDIEDLMRSNFYIATGILQFSVHNVYDKSALDYSITSITKPDLHIKNLPKITLQRGVNNIVVHLEGNSAFMDGDYYLLTTKLPTGEVKQLRFLYKNPATE